ncbi:MAG: endonuclease III [Candidatus Marinimicrobia bacterium]|nr:endonuclease III [Candidatus Neomarinimicrobiota bacterium]|tara:strand:- start:5123 stop:5770 length:648 start_codon:yes stop_codon:yes gene_type:complete
MARESRQSKSERMVAAIAQLREDYPEAKCSLDYRDAHQLLVATILSAQCTDKRVNMVTPGLFKKYRSAVEFAYCNVNELSEDIRSTGYHNQKARSIKGASLIIIDEFGGQVPQTMDQLLTLPGVGRKTANCLLGTAFGVPAVVVDTHMIRITNLLGFTNQRDPIKIESEIMKITPESDWVILTHLVIEHGRHVCIARRPQCKNCSLSDLCPSSVV